MQKRGTFSDSSRSTTPGSSSTFFPCKVNRMPTFTPASRQRVLERAGAAADLIVRGADAVQADADVGEPRLPDADGQLGRDQRPVRREDAAETTGAGACRQLQDIRPLQGLAAGEDDRRRAGAGDVIDEAKALLGGQLAREIAVLRLGIAVHAEQVAAAGGG